MEKILILGASGHARVVHDVFVSEQKFQIAGFIDPDIEQGTMIQGIPVLGRDEDIPAIVRDMDIYGFSVGIGSNYLREKTAKKVISMGLNLEYATGVHKGAIVSPNVKMASGIVVMPGSVINAGCVLDEGSVVNTGATIDHDSHLKDYAQIAPGAHLGGNCFIGKRTYVGLGASVIHKMCIGEDSIIGAGSLIIQNIQKLSIAYGSPAKIISNRKPHEAYL